MIYLKQTECLIYITTIFQVLYKGYNLTFVIKN